MDARDAATYLDRHKNCDVELISTTTGDVYSAHWLALSSRLRYFESMWNSGMRERTESKVNIQASGEVIEFVLNWVYGLDPAKEQRLQALIETMKLADRWNSPPLAKAAHEATTSLTLSAMSLCELLGWSLSVNGLDESVRYVERLKALAPIPQFISIAEVGEVLRRLEVPEIGIWGVNLVCLAIQLTNKVAAVNGTTVSALGAKELLRRPEFDIKPFHNLHLIATDGSKHSTCRHFVPKELTAIESTDLVHLATMRVEGDEPTVGHLVKVLNGEKLESVTVDQFKSVYLLAYQMKLEKVMSVLHATVGQLSPEAADLLPLMEWSSQRPHTDLGMAVLQRLQVEVAKGWAHCKPEDRVNLADPSKLVVALILALLLDGRQDTSGKVIEFRSVAMKGGKLVLAASTVQANASAKWVEV